MVDNVIKVGFKGDGEHTRAHVKPGETLVFENVDFNTVKIDILGPDVILTDPATNAKIFLPGLGLILFSAEDAPQLMLDNGKELSPQFILSKVGTIQNVTQEDFLTFTSLDINPSEGAEQLNLSGLEDNTENEELRNQVVEQQEQLEKQQEQLEEQQEKIEDQQEEFFSIATKMEDFTNEFDGENSSQLRKTPENEDTTPNDDTIEAIQSSRADFITDATGALTKPPAQPASPGTPEQLNDDNDAVGDGTVLAAASLELSASLLQTAAIDDLAGSSTFNGGGASEAGAFDSNNDAQFSRETIDTTVEVGAHTIYTDDPTYFDASTMTRVMQVDPAVPLGFILDDVTVEGIPATFSVYLTDNTLLVPDGSGDYILNSPTLDGNGNLELLIQYPVPQPANTLFLMTISSTASFDPGSGLPTPDETTQTFEILQKVEVKDVNDASTDGNYTDDGTHDFDGDTFNDAADLDGDGSADTVWVLANNANGNRVFTGTGDVTVIGGNGDDQVTSSDGNDIIQTAGGDDIISSGDGDDSVRGGSGSDTMNGGTGTDTVDFSDITDDIVLDLSGPTNGDGFYEATMGVDTDELINFEHIISGDGNDIITGDTFGNQIDGGLGNDTLNGDDGDDIIDGGDNDDIITGGDGNDTLSGGNDTDTVDYSYAAGGITIDLNGVAVVNVGAGDVDTIDGFENVITTAGADIVTGTATANTITTGDGADTINAGDGADIINSGNDGDTINAGSGADTITAGSGVDIIDAGADNDIINAGADNDTITASAGSDRIDGGAGTDTLDYSAGFANGLTVVINDGAGVSILTIGAETDTIDNIENIIGTNFVDNITGDDSDETFRGNGGNDVLNGGAGNDTIYGGLGSDTLDGGTGTNTLRFDDLGVALTDFDTGTMTATTAVDTDTFSNFQSYVLTGQDDSITASTNNDTINAGGGTDFINYSAAGGILTVNLNNTTSTVTGYGTDNLTGVENITTGSGNDVITGNSSGNTIIGGSGDDTIQGQRGNDIMDGDVGTADVLSYTEVMASTILYDMTDVTADGFRIYIASVTETDRAQNFEIIQGGAATDNLIGDSSDIEFYGNGGNDSVTASLGNDIYDGGTGTNTLDYSGADFNARGITVTLTAGLDTVSFAGGGLSHQITDFTIINGSNDVDDITGSSVAETLRGNGGGDTLRGNDGADILEGDDGIDTLYGGDDNDTLRGGGTAGDQLFGEAGDDTLYANDDGGDTLNGGTTLQTNGDTVNYSELSGAINASLLAGNDDDANTLTNIQNLTGSDFADRLTGDANANTLSGGDEDDTLVGGAGIDDLIGGNGTDTIDYSTAAAGTDINLGTGIVSDDGDGDNDTLSSIEDVIGSGFDDTITGSGDANTLDGGTGIDTISGGGDDDIINGGNGDDILNGDDGDDTINGDDGDDTFLGSNGTNTFNGDFTGEINGDTVDYSAYADTITLNGATGDIDKLTDGTTDTLNDIENIIGTGNNDTFNFDTTDLTNFDSIDGDGGTDTVNLDGFLVNEGDALNTLFDNIEEIDFTNTSLLPADDLVITGQDVDGITDSSGSGSLHIFVNAGFSLDLSQAAGGYAAGVFQGTVGSTDTYTFTNGGNTVTLEVETV